MVPQLDMELAYDPAAPLLGIHTGEMKTCVHTETYTHICSSVVHNSQKVDTAQVSMNG